ncbi:MULTISPECIES: transcriptional regulator NrdR [Carboxydocella]|uniref:Transcriptional repressor NrdR n=2 Tax=Carboxydocella TaxID=178898 RepID=A0A1T4Q7N1_9FIRM|nr:MULTISPECIES: transcriptional regulator NrdR [Carboxydocella]AVX19324.1 transcriptional repressor NrdR [Carboxydocella thermautotrophica]AVX29738.1 transcriptional repressor NrdR [Carboxydocella thermautotrophica]SJZ99772.1 transcriptional repressor NrdR [Carboxydocella sporoproducens DSM 16521]GAW27452.1 transcriptional regulator NrdR [Carboxydocella sp. ULO1]GAW30338.1 transcriptional regulator NrdR [Carboxydocella sp. JDF658]
MKCPFCHETATKVVESRTADEGNSIRRRRECENCGKRFTTYERIEERPLLVIKNDGRREVFSPEKLMHGLVKAVEKRPVSMEVLQKIVTEVESQVRTQFDKEVPSSYLGELVMEKLRTVDEVAYVRFASVYRRFRDVNEFMEEIKRFLEGESG